MLKKEASNMCRNQCQFGLIYNMFALCVCLCVLVYPVTTHLRMFDVSRECTRICKKRRHSAHRLKTKTNKNKRFCQSKRWINAFPYIRVYLLWHISLHYAEWTHDFLFCFSFKLYLVLGQNGFIAVCQAMLAEHTNTAWHYLLAF